MFLKKLRWSQTAKNCRGEKMENSMLLESKVFLWYRKVLGLKRMREDCGSLSVGQLWDEGGRRNSASITCISHVCELFGCFLQSFLSTRFHSEIRKDFLIYFYSLRQKRKNEGISDRLTNVSICCVYYDSKTT